MLITKSFNSGLKQDKEGYRRSPCGSDSIFYRIDVDKWFPNIWRDLIEPDVSCDRKTVAVSMQPG